jgi:hypothetical protein
VVCSFCPRRLCALVPDIVNDQNVEAIVAAKLTAERVENAPGVPPGTEDHVRQQMLALVQTVRKLGDEGALDRLFVDIPADQPMDLGRLAEEVVELAGVRPGQKVVARSLLEKLQDTGKLRA